MKIHYNEEFNCFEITECHKTDNIELDGVQLIPITELEKIKTEIMSIGNWRDTSEVPNGYVVECLEIIDKHISELKGENK